MSRRFGLICFILGFLIGLALLPRLTSAGGRPLPPVPPQSVLNQVIAGGGPIFTPLYAPNVVFSHLRDFSGAFDGVENLISVQQAVNYITTGRRLTEVVLPLRDSRTAVLDPNFTAPGTEPRQGKIVGALFQPSRGTTMVIVAIFKPNQPNQAPEKVRFYYNSTQYHEYSIIYGVFRDHKNDRVIEAVDDGAVIAHDLSCVTVGLEQVCWYPYDHNIVRDEPAAKDIAYAAYTRFKDIYNLRGDFQVDDAVPDLIGQNVRAACANQIMNSTSFSYLSACNPNLVFTASKKVEYTQPIGIWVVRAPADLKAYTTTGQHVGMVPIGEYLVIDATPSITRLTSGRLRLKTVSCPIAVSKNHHFQGQGAAMLRLFICLQSLYCYSVLITLRRSLSYFWGTDPLAY
jgi:hypothetical protein